MERDESPDQPEGRVYEFPRGRRKPPAPRGDEADLFLSFHQELLSKVGYRVNSSREIIDDACAYAWAQLLRFQPDRDRNWRAWLVTTAEREAWRLHAGVVDHISTSFPEFGTDDDWVRAPADLRDVQGDRMALREALDVLAKVPERRRRAKALHVIGMSYEEIGDVLGISFTAANRLITEANAIIRQEHAGRDPEQVPRSPRAARLDELERAPARWLVAAIGRVPGKNANAESMLAWRRAALAIDDYRREHGSDLELDALGPRPTDGSAARAYDLALAAIQRLRRARETGRGRSKETDGGASSLGPPSIER